MKSRSLHSLLMALLVAVISLTWEACDRSSDMPHREPDIPGNKDDEEPDPPQGGERPDPDNPVVNFTKELADATLRYEGAATRLRFDRGGVLVKKIPGGSYEFIDLDNSTRVRISLGDMRADSTFPGTSVEIDGTTLALKSVKKKKQTAEAVWFHAVASGGETDIIFVVP
ncbi:MAG: hypothetical protein NC212_06210 [Staphylococcus sp.]|nr:hypothetical protein [Staphylococcus sp.]